MNAASAMNIDDELVPIPRSDWPELRDLYKVAWPKHELAFNTIQNYMNWVELDPRIKDLQVLSLSGTWRENGTYLAVDRYYIFPYSFEDSCDSLKRAFMLLDWDYSWFISNLPMYYRSALDDVFDLLDVPVAWTQDAVRFRMLKEDTTDIQIDLPPGMYLRKLDVEHGVFADRIWPHRHEGSEFIFKRLASWNVSVGLFNETNELLAWSFLWSTGNIGPLEVHPDHYRKGYGTIITKAIAKEVAKIGLNCYGTVISTNEASKGMFTKLGFTAVDYYSFGRTHARKLCEWQE